MTRVSGNKGTGLVRIGKGRQGTIDQADDLAETDPGKGVAIAMAC
jgi:hypothetical protein